MSTTASFDSDEMVAPSQHMPPTPEAEDAPTLQAMEDSEDVERRKRLALALDQTASAMEGGKSLAMAKEELIRSPQVEQQPFPSVDFVAAVKLPDAKEAEQRAKRAEKRRRTILELCDTEALYASDMAVARDIYLERAKGVGESMCSGEVPRRG